jgi:hypothetical protein
VTAAELVEFLQDFYRDKAGLYVRHQAGAQSVASYELNNTYQYVIAREEGHLEWIADALTDAGGTVPDRPAVPAIPDTAQAIVQEDGRLQRSAADRWRERAGALTNARDRRLLDVIVGEMMEHARFFEQAVAGRTDLLGRKLHGSGERGSVLSSRSFE